MSADLSPTVHPALGIDHGDARIGIAATDDFGILAHPVETIDRLKTEPVERIVQLIGLRKIRTVVIGLPVRMDGSEGTSAIKVRKFAKELRRHLADDISIVFVDETLTTSTASEKLRAAGKKFHQQKSLIDQAAAVEILNLWMEE